jgi:hypothetical protein
MLCGVSLQTQAGRVVVFHVEQTWAEFMKNAFICE